MKIKLEDLTTIEFAKFIEKRPGMFFGNQISLTNLGYKILGFDTNSNVESVPPFHYFNFWVKQKLNKLGAGYNWKNAILETYDSNERLSFDKFYELLEEFLFLKPKSIITTFLTEENFAFYYNTDNKNKSRRIIGDIKKMDTAILYPAPYQIKLVEFDYCIHAYHYDFHFVVGDYDKGKHYQEFDSLKSSKKTYEEKFGKLEWSKIDIGNIENEFKSIVENIGS
jgi:hypothetical protein